MFEEFFVGPREMFVLVLDSFLFAHSRKKFVVRLRFLHPKNVMNIERNVMKQWDSRQDLSL
jgi:hypothetical protein